MKLTIISDIRGDSTSIIPFGLKLAKRLHSKVDIVHCIDSREQQGVYSPYSDSQSITPGTKMTHKQIVTREKGTVQIMLDKLLSREASVLNYPLKINTSVEEGSIQQIVRKANKGEQNLFVVSTREDHYIFHSRKELTDTFQHSDYPVFFVPPESEFNGFNKVLIITDFRLDKNFIRLLFTLSQLFDKGGHLEAVSITESKHVAQKKIESKIWKELLSENHISENINTSVLESSDFLNTLNKTLDRIQPDMLLLYYSVKGSLNVTTQKKMLRALMDMDLPVLV